MMFRQHKILCENKEVIVYLFLYDQEIDLETMKNIFSQMIYYDIRITNFRLLFPT